MRSNDIYLLELNIKKCKININESGSVGLLLRAGKNQSHVTELKPIIKGVINFNSSIKLNIDSSALDTQRCSLTLNFISAENIRRIIGIVVINLPEIGEQIQKTFKVTSTPDKEAEIELSICINQLSSNSKVKSKQPEKSSLNPSEKQKKFQNQPEKKSGPSQKQKSIGESLLLMTNKSQQNPTSPPSEATQKLNLKSKRSELQSFIQNDDFTGTIQRLKKEKQMLKELLKLEMQKSQRATNHLKNIIDVLHVAIGVNFNSPLQQQTLRNTLSGESSVLKKDDNFGLNKSNLVHTTPGLRNHHFLDVIKENRSQQMMNLPSDSANRSSLSVGNDKSIDFVGILAQMKKKMQENGESKTEMIKLFEKIKSEPQLSHDPHKMRVLKTKIDKSYLSILGKPTISKDEIFKHKIEINKFLDEFITPAGPK